MKKIWTTSALLFAFALLFSCSSEDTGKDTDDIIKKETFTPVTLQLSSVMGVQTEGENADEIETKAGVAIDAFTSEALFLMIEDGTQPEGWNAYPISMTTDGNTVGFEFSVSTVDSETTLFKNGGMPPVTIRSTTRLFFSSTHEITVQTGRDPDKLTPKGNATLKPYGENLFKSDYLRIIPIENGANIFGQDFTAEQNEPVLLTMFRMTGLLKANLVLFKKNENNPEGVTSRDFTASKWNVTPYLNNYTDRLTMDNNVTGSPAGAYMLSNSSLMFETKNVTGKKKNNGRPFTINTFVAEDTGFFPYIFSGALTGSAIEFVIVKQQQRPETHIAEIRFTSNDQLLRNDRRTINVFMNVEKLDDGGCKAVLLTGEEEELPDVFYCWD